MCVQMPTKWTLVESVQHEETRICRRKETNSKLI